MPAYIIIVVLCVAIIYLSIRLQKANDSIDKLR